MQVEDLKQTDRPEYVKCVKHTHADFPKKSWCGRNVYSFDWVFQDIDHAAYAAMSEARQVPCPECLAEICKVFKREP